MGNFLRRLVATAAGASVLALVVVQIARAQQPQPPSLQLPQETSEAMLTYSRGQAVWPVYEGWHPNEDGTIDLWFGYLNQNYKEEPEIPIGPQNNVSNPLAPNTPDVGQPTHFLPRNNRWTFSVRVPKDFGDKEVVWTLTSHGRTLKAYGTLKPAYVHDDVGMQREFFGDAPASGNKPPEIALVGDARRMAKIGQAAAIDLTVTDDGVPSGRGAGGGAAAGGRGRGRGQAPGAAPAAGAGGAPQDPAEAAAAAFRGSRGSICGQNTNPFFCGEPNEGAGVLASVKGLRVACYPYRSSGEIAFNPPQEKVWEDHRGGSPWAAGYQLPPVPKDGKWHIEARFAEPGTYVVRCQAHDGLLVTKQDITFTVTR
jgi:hypothetical protein